MRDEGMVTLTRMTSMMMMIVPGMMMITMRL